MKKRKLFLFLIFTLFCNLMFAEENNKYLYLKGEADGVEIRIRLLSEIVLGYENYKTPLELQEYFNKYFTSKPNDYNMMLLAVSNHFPVEIINNSDKSVQFNEYNDSLTFVIDGRQMLYDLKVENNDYPKKIFPSGKVLFTIKSLYSEQDCVYDAMQIQLGNNKVLQNENFVKAFILNQYPSIMDYGIKKGKEMTQGKIDQIMETFSKSFYAVYELGIENKEIYLYPVYE